MKYKIEKNTVRKALTILTHARSVEIGFGGRK